MQNSVLYFCALENTFGNNIHKNQVYPLLKESPNIWGLFVNPIIEVSRSRVGIVKQREPIENGSVVYTPFPSLLFFCPWYFFPLVVLYLFLVLIYFCKLKKVKVIHARNLISALAALLVGKIIGVKVIADIRGVYPDEGVLLGRWSVNSPSYKFYKHIEFYVYKYVDTVTCISPELCRYVKKNCKYSSPQLVPAMVNENQFYLDQSLRKNGRKNLNIKPDDFCLIYTGSIGAWHGIEELKIQIDTLKQEKNLNDENCCVIILTNMNHERVVQQLGLKCKVKIFAVEPKDVNYYLNIADIGLLPGKKLKNEAYKIVFQVMISSKAQEYLATGLPVFANPNITYFSKNFSKDKTWNREVEAKKHIKNFASSEIIKKYLKIYKELI